MGIEVINIKQPIGSKTFGHAFRNMYILSNNVTGTITINNNQNIDVTQISVLSDVGVSSLKWNLSIIGEITVILSDAYLMLKNLDVNVKEHFNYITIPVSVGSVIGGSVFKKTITPPEGYSYELQLVALNSEWAVVYNAGTPTSAQPSSGDLTLQLYYDIQDTYVVNIAKFKWDYTQLPLIVGNSAVNPADAQPFDQKVPTPLPITSETPLTVYITNTYPTGDGIQNAMLLLIAKLIPKE